MAGNIMVWTFMTHQGTTLLKNEKNFQIQTGRRYLEIQRRLQIKRMDISDVLIERSQQTPQQLRTSSLSPSKHLTPDLRVQTYETFISTHQWTVTNIYNCPLTQYPNK